MTVSNKLSEKSLEEASAWLVEIESADFDDTASVQFEQWLGNHPDNSTAWERIQAFSNNLDALPSTIAKETLTRTQHQRRNVLRNLVLLGAIGSTGYWLAKRERLFTDLHTTYSQLRKTTLSDGTQLLLGSATAVNVNEKNAHIEVQQGELQWRSSTATAHKSWTIATPQALIMPLGTVFDVRLGKNDTIVRVIKDRVRVELKNGNVRTLSAGQGIRIVDNTITPIEPVEIQRQNAWAKGMLVANNMPLAQFIDEFSRYQRKRISVDDNVKSLRISGSFPIQNPDMILDMLSNTYRVKIERGLFSDKITR